MQCNDNGAYEFSSVCNVTFKGIEIAGSFTKETARIFLRIAKALITIVSWGCNKSKAHQYNKSGKKRQNVMKDKWQGEVLYGKLESVQEIVQLQEGNNQNFTPEQLSQLPDNKWMAKRLEQLAKKHGLEYCIMGHLSENRQTLYLQYPKAQEHIYQEIMTLLSAELKKKCEETFRLIDKENEKKCENEVKECKKEIDKKAAELKEARESLAAHRKVGDKVGERKYGELMGSLQMELQQLKDNLQSLIDQWNVARKQTGMDLIESLSESSKEAVKGNVAKKITAMEFLEQSGLLKASEEEFDAAMTKTYPVEYGEMKAALSSSAKAKTEEYMTNTAQRRKRKAFVRRINNQTRAEARENGMVMDFKIAAAEYARREDKMASFPHPDYPEIMVTISTQGVCGLVDDSHKGWYSLSVYKDAPLKFDVPVLDAVTGQPVLNETGEQKFATMQMTYDDFDHLVKDMGLTAAVAMHKRMELTAAGKGAINLEPKKGILNAKK